MNLEKNNLHLFKHFREQNILSEENLDILRYDLSRFLFHYGDNHKFPYESKRAQYKEKMRRMAKYIMLIRSAISYNKNTRNKIISNAYFRLDLELNKLGYNIFTPPWHVSKHLLFIPHYNTFKRCDEILNNFKNRDFNYLISDEFIEKINDIKKKLEFFFIEENIKAVIFPNDLSLFKNLSLKVFDKLNKPSFVLLHGLPGLYNKIDNNRAKYLMVWGQKIKDSYTNLGVNEDKILVTGHPTYSGLSIPKNSRNQLENILVLTLSLNGCCSDSTQEDAPYADRSTLIYYLYSIQKTLQKFGVSKVRLRCHPGENINWYLKYIDKNFFMPETKNTLKQALDKATLLIGPTSTVLLESVYSGVNYIVYEPLCGSKYNIIGSSLHSPFDKSDERIPVAHNEAELEELLSQKKCVESSFVYDYIADKFDISVVKDIIQ